MTFTTQHGIVERLAKSIRCAFVAGLALIAVASCGADRALAQSGNAIKIGFSLPLTGGLASNGRAILATYQMWQDDINAKGGLLGRKVEFVYYDDQSNPTLVPGIYAKLLDVDRIDLVIAGLGTNMTLPIMPLVMPKNMVLMSLFSLAINEEFKYPNYFSMFPVGSDGVHEISRGYFEIAKERGLQTVAIIGADSDFAKKATDGARANALAMGFRIVHERSYPPTMVDFTPIVRAVQASNPDFVYVASYPTELGRDRAQRKRNQAQDQAVRRGHGGPAIRWPESSARAAAQPHRRARFLRARTDAAVPRH